MTAGVFDGIWRFGQTFLICDDSDGTAREVRGFIEPVSLSEDVETQRSRAGIVQTARLRLISEPKENFPAGLKTRITFKGGQFEPLCIKDIFCGGSLSHRESILIKTGEESDA